MAFTIFPSASKKVAMRPNIKYVFGHTRRDGTTDGTRAFLNKVFYESMAAIAEECREETGLDYIVLEDNILCDLFCSNQAFYAVDVEEALTGVGFVNIKVIACCGGNGRSIVSNIRRKHPEWEPKLRGFGFLLERNDLDYLLYRVEKR